MMMMKAVALLALLGVVSAAGRVHGQTVNNGLPVSFQITKLTCDRNNGDKHDGDFNVVIEVEGAVPGRRVMFYPDLHSGYGFDLGDAVCAEWDNKMEIYSPQTETENSLLVSSDLSVVADEDGKAKFRLPMEDYCYDDAIIVAVQSSGHAPHISGELDGHCIRTAYAEWYDFVGFHFTLELPRFDGTADGTNGFWDVLKEFALHNLLSNDEDGVYDRDSLNVEASPFSYNFAQWMRPDIETHSIFLSDGTVGSVYAYFFVATADYDSAMFQLRHVRRLFDADDDKTGNGRRWNSNGSQILEKELQKRMNAAGLDASMGNILLHDSGILNAMWI